MLNMIIKQNNPLMHDEMHPFAHKKETPAFAMTLKTNYLGYRITRLHPRSFRVLDGTTGTEEVLVAECYYLLV